MNNCENRIDTGCGTLCDAKRRACTLQTPCEDSPQHIDMDDDVERDD